MRIVPRTLAGQLIALLLAALAISQIVAFVILSQERTDALRRADRLGVLENTATAVRLIRMAPPDLRAQLARSASSPRVQIWISDEAIVPAASAASPFSRDIARLIGDTPEERARILAIRDDAISPPPPGDQRFVQRFVPFQEGLFDVVISVPLPDTGWVNAQTEIGAEQAGWGWPSIVSTIIMGVAILAIVAFTARRATRPLRALATRAEALGRGAPGPPLPAEGPEEMRRVTTAFNEMQDRLQRFVADRTRMIAAIGHDLRTPITSLKLRAELLDDGEARGKITATLEEMQRMVEATLAFAREEATEEPARNVDLAALVSSSVDDQSDVGHAVSFAGSERLTYRCRPTALKRALANLIENAVRYGGGAEVSLADETSGPVIAVEDNGPGIPPGQLEEVFKPFVRLESSRSRATGGVGLGLSIARSIMLAHGGELVLKNRPTGGLRAELRLPPGGPAVDRT